MESAYSQESYTTCLVCHGSFQHPKVLPCGHSFCSNCIQQMVEKSFKQCPKCLKKFTLPVSGNVRDFPTNLELINAIQGKEAKSLTNKDDNLSKLEGLQSKNHCILHDNPFEFYCKSCTKQACTKCLLEDHKPSKHNIVTRKDFIEEESTKLEDVMRTLRNLRLKEGDLDEKLTKAINSCRAELKEIEDKILETLEEKIQKLRATTQTLVKEVVDKSDAQLDVLKQLHEQQKQLSKTLQQTQSSCLSMQAGLRNNDLGHPMKLEEIKESVQGLSKEADTLSLSCESMPSKLNMGFLPSVEKTTSVGTLVYSECQTNSQLVWQKTQTLTAHLLFLFIFAIQLFLFFLIGKGDVSNIVPIFAPFSSYNYVIEILFKRNPRNELGPSRLAS